MIKKLLAALVIVQLIGVTSSAGDAPRTGGEPPRAETPDAHATFSEVLGDHVRNGRVNYPDLCADPRFERYLDQLSTTDPDTIADRNDRLAFWINAYNAFTLEIICDNYPVESINDLDFETPGAGTVSDGTVWQEEFIVIGGENMSLDHVEHDIIRADFDEPRVHFALVCAAVSCPPLRSEAYEGHRLDEQLDEQTQMFLSQTDQNDFDLEKRSARLSRIFDWYFEDFGESDRDVLLFVSRFVPKNIAAAIRSDPGGWDIEYAEYDWSLNE